MANPHLVSVVLEKMRQRDGNDLKKVGSTDDEEGEGPRAAASRLIAAMHGKDDKAFAKHFGQMFEMHAAKWQKSHMTHEDSEE